MHRSLFRSVGIHLDLFIQQHVSGLLAEVADYSRFSRTGSILFRSVIVTRSLRLLTVRGIRVSLWLVLMWLIFPWKVALVW